jgi:hypothetical protein
MRRTSMLLSGLALAAGIAFAVAGPANAAPAQTALPGLQSYTGSDVVVQARRRCWRSCVRRRLGICYRWRRHCRG